MSVSRTILKGILYVCKVGYKNNMQDKNQKSKSKPKTEKEKESNSIN
mgnify:CR=1 FL=1